MRTVLLINLIWSFVLCPSSYCSFICIAHHVIHQKTKSTRYMRADEERIKTLNLHVEKLSKEAQVSKQTLDNEVTETQTAQIELDRTAEEFKKVHQERQGAFVSFLFVLCSLRWR